MMKRSRGARNSKPKSNFTDARAPIRPVRGAKSKASSQAKSTKKQSKPYTGSARGKRPIEDPFGNMEPDHILIPRFCGAVKEIAQSIENCGLTGSIKREIAALLHPAIMQRRYTLAVLERSDPHLIAHMKTLLETLGHIYRGKKDLHAGPQRLRAVAEWLEEYVRRSESSQLSDEFEQRLVAEIQAQGPIVTPPSIDEPDHLHWNWIAATASVLVNALTSYRKSKRPVSDVLDRKAPTSLQRMRMQAILQLFWHRLQRHAPQLAVEYPGVADWHFAGVPSAATLRGLKQIWAIADGAVRNGTPTDPPHHKATRRRRLISPASPVHASPARHPHGWTKQELVEVGETNATTFDNIRKAAGIPAAERDGRGALRRFTKREVEALIKSARRPSETRSGPAHRTGERIARAWTSLLT